MNLLLPNVIKLLLNKYGTRPSKIMGQNFLIDRLTLNNIIKTAELAQNDTILEIGPGIGTLTKELAQKAEKVIAVEKDKTMVDILKETIQNFHNIEIIKGNALTTNYSLPTNYKIVSNIPYYLTSPLIRKFLEADNKPESMVLMVQREVAQRICSKPPNMSLLAVSVQFYSEPKVISYVSKKCFWPSPKVDSAIIKISNLKRHKSVDAERFFKVVKAGFSQPRKQLANNLSRSLKKDKKDIQQWLLKNNINPSKRAETLSISDWENLVNSF